MKAEILQLGERMVVVEGGSCAGKTTAIRGIKEKLTGEEWKFWREPGGTEYSERIRDAVQNNFDYQIHPMAAIYGYCSARADLIGSKVIPWLNQGGYAFLDRYWYSTYSYQGGGEGMDKELIMARSMEVTWGLDPKLKILYDLAPELAAERKKGKTDLDRYDIKELDFHRRVRDSYLELVAKDSSAWRVVDASQTPTKVLADSLSILAEFGFIK